MGRFKRVGQACGWPTDGGDKEPGGLEGGPSRGQALTTGTGSNLCTTSLHGPSLTIFGLAWRNSRAVPSNLIAARRPMGGLAFISEPSSAATPSTELAPRLIALPRFQPTALIATANGPTS